MLEPVLTPFPELLMLLEPVPVAEAPFEVPDGPLLLPEPLPVAGVALDPLALWLPVPVALAPLAPLPVEPLLLPEPLPVAEAPFEPLPV